MLVDGCEEGPTCCPPHHSEDKTMPALVMEALGGSLAVSELPLDAHAGNIERSTVDNTASPKWGLPPRVAASHHFNQDFSNCRFFVEGQYCINQ